MLPGARFAAWLSNIAFGWKLPVGEWIREWISKAVLNAFEDMEPGAIEAMRPALLKQIKDPLVPEELKTLYRAAIEPGNPINTVGGIITLLLQSLGTLLGGSQPLSNIMRYTQDKVLETYRLDPQTIITAWRRDPKTFEPFFEDLKEQGWSEPRINALKFSTLFLPNADEQTFWLAREVYEPAMREKYGLDAELPVYADTDFAKIGVTPEQMTNKWRAHWQHASWIQVVEMLHRGLLDEEEVKQWFRLVEIPPFWRQLLIDTAYTWPTRVDVRRWWDMRTIDEARLRELYSGMGYRGKNLDDYVLWTKVYVAFPDLMARWSKGWISIDEVRSELVGLGMPGERVEEMIQTKIKAAEPERIDKERDVTKTDIIKGVKKGVITRDEGIELLVDMGYDEDEADYILAINIPPDEEDVVVKQRELTKTDIIRGLQAEVIDEDQARDRLLELRYSPVDANFLLAIFRALITPPTEPRLREASKADIILAVKKGLITPEDAYLMLQDIDFTPEASQFILEVRAESSPFSPVTFDEFKDLTGKWRKAAGMTTVAFNDKLREAGDELVKITDQVKALEEAVRTEEFLLVDQDVIPEENEKRLKELQVARNRAKAEQQRIQGVYNGLVAEFRQTEV